MAGERVRLAFFAGLCILGILGGYLYVSSLEIPSYTQVKERFQSSEMILLDNDGRPLQQWRQRPQERTLSWVGIENISPAFQNALLRSEDQNFYKHAGVDAKSVVAAIYQRIFKGSPRGSSTLTMQLVKILISKQRGSIWWQKFRQTLGALKLERSWSKSQILEAYSNLVFYRGEYRGLGSAAWSFFAKDPSALTTKEATLLTVLIRSPNADPTQWIQRACWQEPSLCEEFKSWILSARQDFRVEYNSAPQVAQRLTTKGLLGQIKTTLRKDVQDYATEVLRSQVQGLRSQNVKDGSVLVIENSTGNVWAYVGNTGLYPETKYVDGVTSLRQAGSTLKPFLYATAFEKGFIKADSWIEDSALDIVFGSGVYKPRNHDKKFYGWVNVQTALGSSLNVPAVKMYNLLNDESFWQNLKDLHFRNLKNSEHYGPALALGVADVTLEDLTLAYSTFSREGQYRPMNFFETDQTLVEKIYQPRTAEFITKALSSDAHRSLGFGIDSVLSFPGAAVKTGTSKDMRDNWCIGYTPRFTVGVWVGNFSGEPMWNVMGVDGAAPVWRRIVEYLLRYEDSQPLLVESPISIAAPAPYPGHKITYPQNGMILAMDPSIPSENQKVPLIYEGPKSDKMFWLINGKDKVLARETVLWTPQEGRHRFDLYRDQQKTETVEILVK